MPGVGLVTGAVHGSGAGGALGLLLPVSAAVAGTAALTARRVGDWT